MKITFFPVLALFMFVSSDISQGPFFIASSHAAADQSSAISSKKPEEKQWLASLASLLNKDNPGNDIFPLAEALASNSQLRELALKRFKNGTNNKEVSLLLRILTSTRDPEIQQTAFLWASSKEDTQARIRGFDLLASMPPSPKINQIALNEIFRDKETPALPYAIQTLRRFDIPTPDETNKVVSRMHELTLHSDPHIRGASLQVLSEWDRAKHYLEESILRLLKDDKPYVRYSVLAAMVTADIRSEEVKRQLFELLADSKTRDELRFAILSQFRRFPLTQAEYDRFRAVRDKLVNQAVRQSKDS